MSIQIVHESTGKECEKVIRVKQLFSWAGKYWLNLALILFLVVFLQFTFSYVPLFTQYVMKEILGSDTGTNLPRFLTNIFEMGQTPLAMIALVGITLITLQSMRFFLRFVEAFAKGRLTENISKDMRVTLYEHIQDLPYSYHNNVDTGDLIQRCTSDIETSSGFLSNRMPEVLNIIATIGFGAYQVGVISMTLMWVSLGIIPFTAISSIIFFAYVRKTYTAIEESEAKMMTVIQENLSGARVVRAFANEAYEIEKLDIRNKEYTAKNRRFMDVMGIYWGSMDFIVMVQYAITISVGVYLAMDNQLDPSDIVAALMLLGMLVWPMRGLGRIISDFGRTLVAVGRIHEVLEIQSEYTVNGTEKPEIKGNIEFSHVSFKFDDDTKHLLDDVTFSIAAGETVAFIGRTGSGKSTIANILARLLEYDQGSVRIDGVELRDIEKKHLRKHVGMVMQDPFLFSKTVFENIAIASRKAEREQIFKAAQIASIDKDIVGFEKGYETIVGEKGTTLSGGQKQRVAIARMLVEEKPVIIFDDSLSAVDTQTDLMIRRALRAKTDKTTTIIITHRITTAKEADKIIVLENGKVSAVGKHDELAKGTGLYAKLWKIQGELEEEFNRVLTEEV